MTAKRLGVWFGGELVAELEAKRPWDLRCRYSAAAIEAGDANRPLLSCSLPVTRQTDCCQALGVDIDSQQGRGKYERLGGPTFARIADLCERHGDPTTALQDLLRHAVFTWVIGNGDAHGKNVSLLIDVPTGHVELAPLYDTVPTALWPQLRPTAAMSVNGKHHDVMRDDFVAEAHRWGLARAGTERLIDDLAARLAAAAADCSDDRVASLVTERLRTLQH
uniref:HipA-like protein n=1 Tax=uncultured bacterium A1Q1_fos_515 TaxID=1256581 RepID=L7VQR9_9BACT|nr:HipA-like protein [uncultured bacterium A1Q1_fos_515]